MKPRILKRAGWWRVAWSCDCCPRVFEVKMFGFEGALHFALKLSVAS